MTPTQAYWTDLYTRHAAKLVARFGRDRILSIILNGDRDWIGRMMDTGDNARHAERYHHVNSIWTALVSR